MQQTNHLYFYMKTSRTFVSCDQLCPEIPGYPFFLIFMAELELLLRLHAQTPPGTYIELIIKNKRFHTMCRVLTNYCPL